MVDLCPTESISEPKLRGFEGQPDIPQIGGASGGLLSRCFVSVSLGPFFGYLLAITLELPSGHPANTFVWLSMGLLFALLAAHS